jgi:hypothetical protein
LAVSPQKHWANGSVLSGNSPRIEKIPVLFPVSREFGSGDGFAYDCVRHHPFRVSADLRRLAEYARQWRAFLSRLLVSESPDWLSGPFRGSVSAAEIPVPGAEKVWCKELRPEAVAAQQVVSFDSGEHCAGCVTRKRTGRRGTRSASRQRHDLNRLRAQPSVRTILSMMAKSRSQATLEAPAQVSTTEEEEGKKAFDAYLDALAQCAANVEKSRGHRMTTRKPQRQRPLQNPTMAPVATMGDRHH